MEHVDSGDQEREQDFDQREELDDGEYTREREYDRADDRGQNNQHGDAGNNDQQGEVNPGTNLYVTRLSFETTEEDLRTQFSKFGQVVNVSIVKEPVSSNSRGFGFVALSSLEEAEAAIEAMNGATLHGREIKVEKAKRSTGYAKTPGKYLGPPQMSTRARNDRFPSRGPPSSGRPYDREPPIDRYRDDRDRAPPSRGPPGGYRDEPRGPYRDERSYPPASRDYPPASYGGYRDERDYRGPPSAAPGGYRDSRSPPDDYRRGPPPSSYPPADYRGPSRYDYDDRRGPAHRDEGPGPGPGRRGPPHEAERRGYDSRSEGYGPQSGYGGRY